MSLQILFFHPKNQEYYNKISASRLRLVLILTSLIMILTSGLAGMYVAAVARANPAVQTNINYFFSSAIAQIFFLLGLILLQRFIYTNNQIKTNLKVNDIIVIEQLIILKDLLYLIFITVQLGKFNSTSVAFSAYSWLSDARNMDTFLYLGLLIMIVFYLIPKILPRFEVTRRDLNVGMIYSIIVSIAIVVCVTIIASVIQTIVEIPLGV